MNLSVKLVFFFSSRRRHTRFDCDWSSDVCSSDLFVRTETVQHIALFDKCKNFTRAREVQAAGLYPYFKPITRSEDTIVMIEGRERIMMGSNNYLGITHHPEVLLAAKGALERYGSGFTCGRLLNR